jgi:hypothetical protein
MFELKPLARQSIPAALEKAHQYRLMREPREAESVCDDVLAVEPDNQEALKMKLLAITDRFDENIGDEVDDAKDILPKLTSEYVRAYCAGVICEKRGKVIFAREPQSGPAVYDWLHKGMKWFEHAERLAPDADDEPRLRWNTCARIINDHRHVRPPPGPPTGEWRIADLAGKSD